ncbi:MAG: SGNH/GDSL hydrolase family protein [Oscillospiraceae bacterium]
MLDKGDRIVMAGDSVTDAGRGRPLGEFSGLGTGYPLFFEAMITANHPQLNIQVTNSGISGDTSRDLLARFREDVIDLKPQCVTLLIGVNDVWRHFDNRFWKDQVSLDEYENNLQQMVKLCKKNDIRLIMMPPFFFEPNKNDAMRHMVDEYAAAMKKVAEENELLFIDLQARIDEHMKYIHPMSITADRVHPDSVSHYIIADEIMKKI